MKKSACLTISILLCISLTSCDKNAGMYHYQVDPRLKAAFNYKQGTYWIYKETITGRVDSFAVLSNTFKQLTGNSIVDQYGMFIKQYARDSKSVIGEWGLALSKNDFSLTLFESSLDSNFKFGFSPAFVYPFRYEADPNNGATPGASITMTKIPSYSILGRTYYNLEKVNRLSIGSSDTNYNHTFFVDSTLGIIKMDLYVKKGVREVLELQSYDFVK